MTRAAPDMEAILARSRAEIARMQEEATPRRAPSASMKKAILAKSGGRCAKCGGSLLGGVEYDHFVPLWMKGEHSVRNMDALCIPCHDEKTAEDAGNRAEAIRRRLAHVGAKPPSRARLRSRPFSPSRPQVGDPLK